MSTDVQDSRAALCTAVQSEEPLRRLAAEIERLFRVVFHRHVLADGQRTRRAAEQILIAEITHRYRGDPQGVRRALADRERGGRPWDEALRELAGEIHSYYTTPLGMVMRAELFGDDVEFVSAEAEAWLARQRMGSAGA